MTGCCGLEDLTLNSTAVSDTGANPLGNISVAVNICPGCGSLSCTSTSLALTAGSVSLIGALAAFRIVRTFVTAVSSGVNGRLICGGITMMAGCTLAIAETLIKGVLVEVVVINTWPGPIP